MVRKVIFWTIGKHLYFVCYPIISYQRIKVYGDEKFDMGRYLWKNGVSGDKILSPGSMAKLRIDVQRKDVDTLIFHMELKNSYKTESTR